MNESRSKTKHLQNDSPFQIELCDETYAKNCYINFLEETSNVEVKICERRAVKLCDSPRSLEPSGPSIDDYKNIMLGDNSEQENSDPE